MIHHSPVKAVTTVSRTMSRPQLPPLIGNFAQLRSALTDKRTLIARIEAEWVATAETAITKHILKHVRIGDRATWDGETYKRYMAEAERIEPEFKPRLRRLLTEIDNLERVLSPAPLRATQTPPDGSHGDKIMLHCSITPERICQAVQRAQTSLDNPGFCTNCGAGADGVEPDAEGYECESCGAHAVCGAEDLFIRIM